MKNILKISKSRLYKCLIRNFIIFFVLLFVFVWFKFLRDNIIVTCLYFGLFFLQVVIPNILLLICYFHDKNIVIIIDEDKNVFYNESNLEIIKFNVSDIVSISYSNAVKFGMGYCALNLKNNISIYVSDLIDIHYFLNQNPKIETEMELIFFFEEIWNPIYKVENQLRLLKKNDL